MKVFKFGGASVNSADAVKNVVEILTKFQNQKLLVVISAMGKTTNGLEKLTKAYYHHNTNEKISLFNEIKQFHYQIIENLFLDKSHKIYKDISEIFSQLNQKINIFPSDNFDFEYDQIVSFGEIFSTMIVSNYVNNQGIKNIWIDAREIIKTDSSFREGKVNWEFTSTEIKNKILTEFSKTDIIITQGFIGSTNNNFTTTLGREGSDYSAAIFAYGINAEEMIIWKDVPGLLNADPKFFKETIKLDAISYREAIELAYYGATIIHPKTIKPLQNKNIPLWVKSFLNPDNEGTKISNIEQSDGIIPSFIFKQNQVLISISARDFSFIAEENLSEIFAIISYYHFKINLMQNSAISFSICIDSENHHFDKLIEKLQQNFKIKYNTNLDLITIRHYDNATINKVVSGRKILLEQRSRLTAQIIVEN